MLTAYRAALPGTVLLTSIIAFALAICCLLAGQNPKTLPNMQLFTLNTSRIGANLQRELGLPPPDPSFNFSTMLPRDITDKLDSLGDSITHKGDDLIGDAASAIHDPRAAINSLKANITSAVNDGKKSLDAAASKIKDEAKNTTAEIVSTFINETISTLRVQDFYLAHLTTYCEGKYTSHGKETILFCSNSNSKNFTAVANGTTKNPNDPFVFIDHLHLPDPISYLMKAVTLLSKLLAAIYILALICLLISILTSGFSLPGAITSLTGGSAKLRYTSLAASVTAFLCLLLGSILVNVLAKKIVGFFNDNKALGITADRSGNFMGVSVASLVFTGIAAVVALGDVFLGRATAKVGGIGGKAVKRMWFGRKKQGRKEYEMDERA